MPEIPFGPLESLVGRTFEFAGKGLLLLRIVIRGVRAGRVFFTDGIGAEWSLGEAVFIADLSGAKEVKT